MPEQFFVTGTDTDVGKTVLSALLCAALNAVYWKPIQTGAIEGCDRDRVLEWAEIAGSDAPPEAYRLNEPLSPHLAAQRAGITIEVPAIRLPSVARDRAVVVEGAGGVLVPINERLMMVDLIRSL